MEFRWLRLAEQAREMGRALGHESDLTATVFSLRDKPAPYPEEYGKRAGELIARSARSLHGLHPTGADWLDRLELMMVVEDQFAGVEITDDDVDQIEVVGDLIRFIETLDSERQRQGAARVVRKLFGRA